MLQQKREMQLDRFEPLYLDLMRDIWEVQKEIYYKNKKGYEAIVCLAEEMKPVIGATEIVKDLSSKNTAGDPPKRAQETNELLQGKFPDPNIVRNGFRPFLHAIKIVLRFLKTAPLSEMEKRRYAEWISGYFYQDELFVVALLVDDDTKELIEKYALLVNMEEPMAKNFKLLGWKGTAFSARSETGASS